MPYERYKSLRLAEYDYSSPGAYFVTICAKNKVPLFGNIQTEKMYFNAAGEFAANEILDIPNHYDCVGIGENIVMPNHVHMVVYIYESTVANQADAKKPIRLQDIIGSYKSGVTRKAKLLQGFENFAWQRYYFDHITRNDHALANISDYIKMNPAKWSEDLENLEYMKSLETKEREKKLKMLYKELCIRNNKTVSGKP